MIKSSFFKGAGGSTYKGSIEVLIGNPFLGLLFDLFDSIGEDVCLRQVV